MSVKKAARLLRRHGVPKELRIDKRYAPWWYHIHPRHLRPKVY